MLFIKIASFGLRIFFRGVPLKGRLMHIENLKIFCDLVETKSFSKAAKTNSVTQSAVSQQLRATEKNLDAKIIDRAQKQFHLTHEGEIFYRFAKNILREIEQLRSDLQTSQSIVAGRLQISTIYSIGLYELPPFLKAFMQSFPAVSTHLEYRHCNRVYEDILNGDADLGLVAYPQKHRQIETLPFMQDRLAIICPPNHPLAKNKAIALKELQGQKFIAFEFDVPTRKAIDKYLHEAHVDVVSTLEVDSVETMKRAVEIGIGVAITPVSAIAYELSQKTLACIEIKNKSLLRPLAIVYRKGRTPNPAMQGFIDTLTSLGGKTSPL
jgi:LysR family transcriptional regulator, transcriptional activator of the cysJI operon